VKQFLAGVLFFLAACRDERPPQPTAEQAQQLNEAEDLLDNMAGNEEGPEQRPGPSNTTD
jgi:hypothetical protein